MRYLKQEEKNMVFNQLLRVNDMCYDGTERPPKNFLRTMVMENDVLVSETPEDGIVGFTLVRNTREPYVWSVAVLPSYRNQGIARRMLETVSETYRQKGHQTLTLTCRVDNPAQKIYFDAGYRVYGIAKGYYGPEGDGLMMRKIL